MAYLCATCQGHLVLTVPNREFTANVRVRPTTSSSCLSHTFVLQRLHKLVICRSIDLDANSAA